MAAGAVSTRPNLHDRVWTPGKHILELDGLRGFAILVVTLYRFLQTVPESTTLGSVLHQGAVLGQRGVDLFFVLSGFLITGILLQSRQAENPLRNFFARRVLRIFPLYFAALALFLFVIPNLTAGAFFQAARDQQFYLWTYMSNMRMAWQDAWSFGALDHFWSLAIEEHFYLLWPFVLLLLPRTISAPAVLGMAGICAAGRVAFAMFGSNDVACDVASLFRFDGLLLGSALAIWAQEPGGLNRFRTLAKIVLPVMLAACVLCTIRQQRWLTIPHTGWALVWASLLILLTTARPASQIAKFFRATPLRFLGKYSYAMYVFQSPLIPLTAAFWSVTLISSWLPGQYGLVASHVVYAAGMFGITVLLALCSWNLLEKHCLKLKRYFPTQSAVPRPTRVPAKQAV